MNKPVSGNHEPAVEQISQSISLEVKREIQYVHLLVQVYPQVLEYMSQSGEQISQSWNTQASRSRSLCMDKPVAQGRARSPKGALRGTPSFPGSGTNKPVSGTHKPVSGTQKPVVEQISQSVSLNIEQISQALLVERKVRQVHLLAQLHPQVLQHISQSVEQTSQSWNE